jgi:hypothetical protein
VGANWRNDETEEAHQVEKSYKAARPSVVSTGPHLIGTDVWAPVTTGCIVSSLHPVHNRL